MRLYHHPLSSNARRAVMTALQLGTKVDLEVVNLAAGDQKKPEFLRMNPNGRVPVLDDNGFYLWESHAIMQYLADKTPGQTVYPTDLQSRADVNRWLFWSANHFTPAVSVLNWENVVKPFLGQGPAHPLEVQRGERLVMECARVLQGHLEGREWMCGDRMTLADIALCTPLAALETAKLPITNPRILAWFEKMQALEIWKKTSLA